MERLIQVWRTAVRLGSIVVCASCGAHTIDLDQSSGASTPGSAADAGALASAELDSDLQDFWVDDSRIYWFTYGVEELRSCVYENCAATELNYGVTDGAVSLAESDLFFVSLNVATNGSKTTGRNLLRCPKAGCDGPPERFLQDSPVQPFLNNDGQYLYWSSSFDVFRCPLSGCGEIPETVVKGVPAAGPVITEGARAYFFEVSSNTTDSTIAWQMFGAPSDGSELPSALSPVDVGDHGDFYQEPTFAVDARSIYWIAGGSQILSCPLTGCGGQQPVTLVATPSPKRHLEIDEAGLYWLDDVVGTFPTGTVYFCPFPGCGRGAAPTALTSGVVRKFALDSQYLYWDGPQGASAASYGTDKLVYRAAKPTPTPSP